MKLTPFGEGGIRTPGTSQYNGFQDRRNRPLCHLSKTPFRVALFLKSDAKVRIIFEYANVSGKKCEKNDIKGKNCIFVRDY